MATAAQVTAYRAINGDLNTLAQREMTAFLSTIAALDTEAKRVALEAFMPALIDAYGKPAALLAAQFYDELRSTSAATGKFRARVATNDFTDQVKGTVRWAVGAEDPAALAERLAGATQRYLAQSGRDTIAHNMSRDRSSGGWARVPSGGKTCKWCVMLASRGPVYGSAESAGDGAHYHDKCDCVPTPIWEGDSLPEGYDPDALYELYEKGEGVGTEPKAAS